MATMSRNVMPSASAGYMARRHVQGLSACDPQEPAWREGHSAGSDMSMAGVEAVAANPAKCALWCAIAIGALVEGQPSKMVSVF